MICPVCDQPDARLIEHLFGHRHAELVEHIASRVVRPALPPPEEEPRELIRTAAGITVEPRRAVEAETATFRVRQGAARRSDTARARR